MDILEIGPFTIEVEMSNLTVRRGDARITFAPGETATATSIVGTARMMERMKVLPPKIANSPWEVLFFADGSLEWKRNDRKNGIKFTFQEADELVQAIDTALNKYADAMRIRGGPGAGVSALKIPDPPFDGR
jgi:hypothetical protein